MSWHVLRPRAPHTAHTRTGQENFANSFHLISFPFAGFLNMHNHSTAQHSITYDIWASFLEFLIANNNFKRFLLTRISQVEFDAIDEVKEANATRKRNQTKENNNESVNVFSEFLQETGLKLSCGNPRVD